MTAGANTPDQIHERSLRLSGICFALPGTTREDKGEHTAYRVGKKVFVYFLNSHHGDSIVSVCCKVLPGDNERLIHAHPRKFYMPSYIGPRGWVALRLDLPTVNWTEVKELVHTSYIQLAPKKFVSLIPNL
jgi:phosphoribosylglycinamide formyltransferase-1